MFTTKKDKYPPGPEGQFLIGHLNKFANETLDFVQHCAYDYDGIAHVHVGPNHTYIISKPEYIRHLLQKNHRNYVKSFAYDGLKHILGQGLLTSEGDFWMKQRRLAQPAFHKKKVMNMVSAMAKKTEEMLQRWEQRDAEYVDIGEEMRQLAQHIVTETMFGSEVDDRTEEVGEYLELLLNYADALIKNPLKPGIKWPTPYNLKVKKGVKALDEIIYGIIDGRQKSGEDRHDLLGMLMQAEDEDTGEKMSRQQLRDEILTVFLAGQETTANALTFTFYLLSQHQSAEENLLKEYREVLNGRSPEMKDVPNLKFTLQVIRESMRLCPPVWAISREALEEDEIAGYKVFKGHNVFVPIHAMHRHPKYWDDPNEFKPERFEDPHFYLEMKNIYMPFGGGPRMCIGNNFALTEMQVAIPIILQGYHLALHPDFKLEFETPITLTTKNPMMMKPVSR